MRRRHREHTRLECDRRHEGRETHYGAQLAALAPLIDWTGEMARWASRLDDVEDLLKGWTNDQYCD